MATQSPIRFRNSDIKVIQSFFNCEIKLDSVIKCGYCGQILDGMKISKTHIRISCPKCQRSLTNRLVTEKMPDDWEFEPVREY